MMTNMNRHVDPKSLHPAEWSVAEAKARFSEVLARARAGEPQRVSRYGKTEVVVVSAADWARQTASLPSKQPPAVRGESLLDAFASIRESGAGDDLAEMLDQIAKERRHQALDPGLIER